jgi:hypothetical protein
VTHIVLHAQKPLRDPDFRNDRNIALDHALRPSPARLQHHITSNCHSLQPQVTATPHRPIRPSAHMCAASLDVMPCELFVVISSRTGAVVEVSVFRDMRLDGECGLCFVSLCVGREPCLIQGVVCCVVDDVCRCSVLRCYDFRYAPAFRCADSCPISRVS